MAEWRRAFGGLTAFFFLLSIVNEGYGATSDEKSAAAVDEVFSDLTKSGSPGCALGVYRDGKIIYAKGYGLANIEENVAITPQSVFDIGSTSKQFTAASILLLEKQGKLSVNDDIRKYIPELPDYGQKITILQLLNHTSGLRDYLTLMELAGVPIDSVTTDTDALALITRQKALNFAAGSEWLYSNTGFFLLSTIVQRVSSKTLREFAAENIFAPLEMTHTQFRNSHAALIANRALAYDEQENHAGYTLNVSYFEQTGDGAVHTSVEDLLKWDENFYSPRVGGKEFLAEIQERGKLNNGKVLEYAKGLRLQDYRGLPTVSHGGSCNLMKSRENKSKESDNKESVETTIASEELKNYAGDYWSEELGASYRLGVEDGRIKILAVVDGSGSPRGNNFSADVLHAVGSDEFEVGKSGVTLHFQRGAKQAASGFRLDAGRTKGIIFQRRPIAARAAEN